MAQIYRDALKAEKVLAHKHACIVLRPILRAGSSVIPIVIAIIVIGHPPGDPLPTALLAMALIIVPLCVELILVSNDAVWGKASLISSCFGGALQMNLVRETQEKDVLKLLEKVKESHGANFGKVGRFGHGGLRGGGGGGHWRRPQHDQRRHERCDESLDGF